MFRNVVAYALYYFNGTRMIQCWATLDLINLFVVTELIQSYRSTQPQINCPHFTFCFLSNKDIFLRCSISSCRCFRPRIQRRHATNMCISNRKQMKKNVEGITNLINFTTPIWANQRSPRVFSGSKNTRRRGWPAAASNIIFDLNTSSVPLITNMDGGDYPPQWPHCPAPSPGQD